MKPEAAQVARTLARAWKNFVSHNGYDEIPQWQRLFVNALLAMGISAVFTIVGFVPFASGDGAWPLGANLAGGDFRSLLGCLTDMNDLVRFVLIFSLIAFWFNVIFGHKARALDVQDDGCGPDAPAGPRTGG